MKLRVFLVAVCVLLPTVLARSVQYDAEQMGKLVPQRGTFKHKRKISELHDAYKRQSTLLVEVPLPIGGMERLMTTSAMSLQCFFVYPEYDPQMPQLVGMAIVSQSNGWKYLRGASVYGMADGDPVELGNFENVQADVVFGSNVRERLFAAVPVSKFLKLANGRNISFQIAGREFRMKEDCGEALRDFASRMRKSDGSLKIQGAIEPERREETSIRSMSNASSAFDYKDMDVRKENGTVTVRPKGEAETGPTGTAMPAPPSVTQMPAPIASGAKVKWTLETTPPGATITIDGIEVGKTPQTITLTSGTHRVSVSLYGYKSWERELAVTEGKMTLRLEAAW